MVNIIVKKIISTIILSIVLFVISVVIRLFMKESNTPLSTILFWVGAAPVIVCGMGSFGNFMGRGDASYQMSRSVAEESSDQRAVQDLLDVESMARSGLNWAMAGVLLWLVSSFI